MATYPSPTLQDLTVNGAASLANVSSAEATITGGTIDGVTIGATTAAAATVTDLTASGTVSGTGITNLLSSYPTSATLSASGGSALVGFQQLGTGAALRTVSAKEQDTLAAVDFTGVDPTGGTDSTTGLQNAINEAIATGKRLDMDGGTYLVSAALAATGPVSISGSGKYTTIIKTNQANASIFTFSGLTFDLSDMQLSGPSTGATSGNLITTSNASADNSESIRNVSFNNYWTGISAAGNAGHYSGLDFLNPASTSSVGIYVNGYNGGLALDNIFMYVPTVTPTAGVQIVKCGALQISDSNIIKQGHNLLINPATGQSVFSVQASNCYFDSAQVNNVYIDTSGGGTASRLFFSQCETSSATSHGFFIYGTAGDIDGVLIVSGQANGCGGDGLLIEGTNVKNIDVIGGEYCGNAQSGVDIEAGASNVRVTGVFAGSGYGFGGNVDGFYNGSSGTGIVFRGCTGSGNTSNQFVAGNASIIFCTGYNQTNDIPLSGGTLIQHGTFTSSATTGNPVAVTFPTAFPTGCLAVIPTSQGYTGSTNAATWVDTLTASGFNGHCSITNVTVAYIALGY